MGVVDAALQRLNGLLPLTARQQALPPELARLHRAILRGFVSRGRPLQAEEIAGLLGNIEPAAALERLAADDLLVLDAARGAVLGAYPLTLEATPHRLTVNGFHVNAMCALDALSVAPLFGMEVAIRSRCHITGEVIVIRQQGMELLEASPSRDIRLGVRWQDPQACAAHSLCLQMVFLKDAQIAHQWQGGNLQDIGLFDLDEAVAFGAAFFGPLLAVPQALEQA